MIPVLKVERGMLILRVGEFSFLLLRKGLTPTRSDTKELLEDVSNSIVLFWKKIRVSAGMF